MKRDANTGNLQINRKVGESLVLDLGELGTVTVTVIPKAGGDPVWLRFDAPRSVEIWRAEIVDGRE